jgi:hypothetical protein
LSKKIKSSSDHNPDPFCNAVQSLEVSRLRATFTHATASTTNKKKTELQRENQHSIQAQDGRPRKRQPCCLPLPLFNGTMNGTSKKGNDGDSYAVWRARLVNNLRVKRLLSIDTGNGDDELQPSVQLLQARAAHIMTSALGSCPFLFVQGVNNDSVAILRILDSKYQGTDTSSVMSALTSSPPRSTVLVSTLRCLSQSSKDLPCVWKRLVTVSRYRCALSTFSTLCLRSRPYLPSCRRIVS